MSERRKEGGYSAHHLYFRMILFESSKNALSYYLSFSVALHLVTDGNSKKMAE